MSDLLESLRNALREGDHEAYRSLVRRLSAPLFRYVRRKLTDDAQAQDVVQQTFVNLFRTRSRLSAEGSVRAYCFLIATNLVRDERRRSAARHKRETEALEARMQANDRELPAHEFDEALAQLPEELADVLRLRFGQGLTAGEAALTLGIPEGTVRTRQRTALERLREKLLSVAPLTALDDARLEQACSNEAGFSIPDWVISSVEAKVMASIQTKASVVAVCVLLLLLFLGGGAALVVHSGGIWANDAEPNAVAGTISVRDGAPLTSRTRAGNETGGTTQHPEGREGGNTSSPDKTGSSEKAAPKEETGREKPVRTAIARVIDSATEQPIAGATVEFLNFGKVAEGEQAAPKRTGADGEARMRFEPADSLPSGAAIAAFAEGYEGILAQTPASSGVTVIKLVRLTVILVRLEGSECVPSVLWLKWAEENNKPPLDIGGEFNLKTRIARVEIYPHELPDGPVAVCAQWFTLVLESKPLTVEAGKTYEVVLSVGQGAKVNVRVLGPDSRPMAGVLATLTASGDKELWCATDNNGMAVFDGLATPETAFVNLVCTENAAFFVRFQHVELNAAADFREVTFDLSGCGTVELDLKTSGEPVSYLKATGADGKASHISLTHPRTAQALKYIHGLKPGAYSVEAESYAKSKRRRYEAEFEVLPPPQISVWSKEFASYRVEVAVSGFAKPDAVVCELWQGADMRLTELKRDASGLFVAEDLSAEALCVRAFDGNATSKFVEVDPKTTARVELAPVTSGKLLLKWRYAPFGRYRWVRISGLEPATRALPVQAPQDGRDTALDVPAGRYRLSIYSDLTPQPTEVEVKEGETAECLLGPEFVNTLEVRMEDRTSLWDFKVELLSQGTEVRCAMGHISSDGDAWHEIQFEAEGKLKLRISREGYETFEREIEIKRNERIRVDVVLKRSN